jgi:hypothetical protein
LSAAILSGFLRRSGRVKGQWIREESGDAGRGFLAMRGVSPLAARPPDRQDAAATIRERQA